MGAGGDSFIVIIQLKCENAAGAGGGFLYSDYTAKMWMSCLSLQQLSPLDSYFQLNTHFGR